MLDVCFACLFVAEPPSDATCPRNFVFDEFRCDQGSHHVCMGAPWQVSDEHFMKNLLLLGARTQNKQNRFADANRPPSIYVCWLDVIFGHLKYFLFGSLLVVVAFVCFYLCFLVGSAVDLHVIIL